MEEKIKDIEVIAYKGIELDMSCGDFHQYEIGKTYKTDKAELWKCGFHAYLSPQDILEDYLNHRVLRYFKVLLSGEITKCGYFDTKVAATEITILEEITFDELNNITEWWKNKNVLDLLYFSDGLARVKREDELYNLIDRQGNILFNEWFNYLDDFRGGFAKVQRGYGLWNFIDKKGKILSDEWFNFVDNFHDGFAKVQRKEDKQYNFIDKQGKLLSNEWFSWVNDFRDGFAKVKRTNGEQCKIDKNGKIVIS